MTVELRTADPETIEVLDYDFIFETGVALSLTLRPGDGVVETGDGNTQIELQDTGEIYEIAVQKVLYSRRMARTITVQRPAVSAGVPPRAVSTPQPAIDSLQVLPEPLADRRG